MTTSYANSPEEAIVQIWSSDDQYWLGVGFLVADNLVITCAHVLSTKDSPGWRRQVTVEFMYSADHKHVPASVKPRQSDQDNAYNLAARDDIAVLRLAGPTPSDARPARLPRVVRQGDSPPELAHVFGVPGEATEGVWLEVTLSGPRADGLVQLNPRGDLRIKPGFSGALVWHSRSASAVGMVVERIDTPDTAYMIPSERLRAFAGLGSRPDAADPAVVSGAEYARAIKHEISDTYPALRGYIDCSEEFEKLDRADFTGRGWLLPAFDSLRREHDRGYLFIEGEAGVGKTTLCAWLAKRYNGVPHFVGSEEPATAALRSIAVHLVARYQLTRFVDDEELSYTASGPSGFRQVLTEAADRARSLGHSLVLVVDGLDRAPDHPPEQLPLGLPVTLPPNVYVIATMRVGTTLDALDKDYQLIRLSTDDANNCADLAEHLDKVMRTDAVIRTKLSDQATAVRPILLERCAGLWLYLHHVLEDIRGGLLLTVDDARGLPGNLWGYYGILLDRVEKQLGTRPERLLGALGCAREPVSIPVLLAFAGYPEGDAEFIHRVETTFDGPWLSAFLRQPYEQPSGSGYAWYTTYHDSFKDFLVGAPPTSPGNAGGQSPWSRFARNAVQTHNRVIDRYLTAWGGLDQGLPGLLDDTESRSLDEGYGLRQVVMHFSALIILMKDGDHAAAKHNIDRVHHVLRSTTLGVNGAIVNVWFEAHMRTLQLDSYSRDLEYARTLAVMATDSEPEGYKSSVGLELRYALMSASARSLTRILGPSLFAEMVKRGIWDFHTACRYLSGVSDDALRAKLLTEVVKLSTKFPAPLLDAALWLVWPPNQLVKWTVALALIDQYEEPRRSEIIAELAVDVQTVELNARGRYLEHLLPYLTDAQRTAALEAADHWPRPEETDPFAPVWLRSVTESSSDESRDHEQWRCTVVEKSRYLSATQVFHDMHQLRPTKSAEEPKSDEDRRRQAVAAVCGIPHGQWYQLARALQEHGPYLTQEELRRQIKYYQRYPDKAAFARVTAATLSYLPEESRPRLIRRTLRNMQRGDLAHIYMAETLAMLAPNVRDRNAIQAAELARSLKYGNDLEALCGDGRCPVLLPIARELPPAQRDALLSEYLTEASLADKPDNERAVKIIEAFLPLVRDALVSSHMIDSIFRVAAGLSGMNRMRVLDALAPYLTGKQLEEVVYDQPKIGDHSAVRTALAQLYRWRGDIALAAELVRDDLSSLVTLAKSLAGSQRIEILRLAVRVWAWYPRDRRIYWSPEEAMADILDGFSSEEITQQIKELCKGPYRSPHNNFDYPGVLALIAPSMSDRQLEKVFRELCRCTSEIVRSNGFAVISKYLPVSFLGFARELVAGVMSRTRVREVHFTAKAGLIPMLPEIGRPAAVAEIVAELPSCTGSLDDFIPIIFDCLGPHLGPEEQAQLVNWVVNSAQGRGGPEASALPVILRYLEKDEQTHAVLRVVIASCCRSSSLPGVRPGRTLNAIGAAPVWFWQEMIDAARLFVLPHQKAATLASCFAGAARVSWQERSRDDSVGPAREYLGDLPRAELLTVIGGLARHIKDIGGTRALQEAIKAVEDVGGWWP